MNLFKSDVLSKYSDYNKEKLFDFIYKTPFEYRTTLSIDKDVKFGTEIEFIVNALKREKMYKYIHNNTDYNIHIESVCNHCDINFLPLEISTSILTNNKDKLLELKSIFDYLYENNSCINLLCSNHIHYDKSILKNKYKYYDRFLKFYSVYEPIIYKFGCGEIDYLRDTINTYSKDIGKDYLITKRDNSKDNIAYLLQKYDTKSRAIRFSNFNTIEIRTCFSTLNPCINQNNILFFYKIFKYVTSSEYDNEYIDNKFNEILNRENYVYSKRKVEIDVEEALYLSDILYDNNLDKILFLKQVLKLYTKKDLKKLRIKK